jgi:hypothetical protein
MSSIEAMRVIGYSDEVRGPMGVPSNNALHLTGRGGVAVPSPRPVVEARPAGEREC